MSLFLHLFSKLPLLCKVCAVAMGEWDTATLWETQELQNRR